MTRDCVGTLILRILTGLNAACGVAKQVLPGPELRFMDLGVETAARREKAKFLVPRTEYS